jgi:hypothetical protein
VYPKVSGLGHNEINNNNKHSLRSNTKGYGGRIHWTDSQNSDTTTPSGRELYHLQFSLQVAGPETFGYTLVLFNGNGRNRPKVWGMFLTGTVHTGELWHLPSLLWRALVSVFPVILRSFLS